MPSALTKCRSPDVRRPRAFENAFPYAAIGRSGLRQIPGRKRRKARLDRLFSIRQSAANRAASFAEGRGPVFTLAPTACAIIPANVHEITMSDSLNYLYGYRAESTVTMVKTALNGIENMEDAFDDPTAYLLHCGYQEPEWLTKELGEHWMMMDMLLVKHWPANVFVQTYAELAARLVTKNRYNPDDIEEIVIRPSVAFRHWYSETGYESVTQAQFSIPYAAACAMYHPEPGAVWYQPETMKDPKIVALMNKVKADGFVKRSGMKFIKDLIDGKHPEKFMTVRMKDGTEYVESAFTHPGHPSYMLTRDEFKDRFRLETRKILAPEKIEDRKSTRLNSSHRG